MEWKIKEEEEKDIFAQFGHFYSFLNFLFYVTHLFQEQLSE
jgi:hypothetical protein